MAKKTPLCSYCGKSKEVDQSAPTLFVGWLLVKFENMIISEGNRIIDEIERRWPRK